MKAYTDLEQSKKLAEFLPLESADFHFSANQSPQGYLEKPIFGNPEYADYNAFPCWSLAALLGVIKEQGIVDLRFLQSTFDNRGNHLTNVWCCTFEDIGNVTLDLYAGNSIDACYEMIIKLHELKML